MTGLPARLRYALSGRALEYAGIGFTSIEPDSAREVECSGCTSVDSGCEVAGKAAVAFNGLYGGLSVLSLGGPLEGRVRLEADSRSAVKVKGRCSNIFRCGRSSSIQCVISCAADGRFGCSWSGEFTPLFDSVNLYIENAAAWGAVQGWKYVAVGDLPIGAAIAALGGMVVDSGASGQLSGWWISKDCALVVQQYLNPARSRHPQVSILARVPEAKEEVRRRLTLAGLEKFAFEAAEVVGTVPLLPSG